MATFGYASSGASVSSATSGAIALVGASTIYAASTGDTITGYSSYHGTTATLTSVEMSVYNVSGGLPVTRQFAATSYAINTTGGRYDSAGVSQSLTGSTTYSPAMGRPSAGTTAVRFDTGSGAERSAASADTLQATWTSTGTSASKFSIFVTYVSLTGDMASSDTTTFSKSATLIGSGSLASSKTVAFSSSATLFTPDALNSSVTTTFTESATLTAVGALASAVTFTFSDSATLGTGPVTIFDNFERSSVNVALSSVVGNTITLKPRQNDNETAGFKWRELVAGITNIGGQTPDFVFLDLDDHADTWVSTRYPMYSYDRENFFYFDNKAIVGTTLEFSNNTPFTENTVYVSRGRHISPRQWGQFVEDYAARNSAWVSPTPTAAAFTPSAALTGWPAQSYIAEEFSTQTDDLGRTVPETPFYAMRINDTSLSPPSGTKFRVIWVCGTHAGEEMGAYTLRKVLEHLEGSSTEALAARAMFEIDVVGFVNAPGIQGGSWRSGFDQGTGGADDANRHFSDVDGGGLETVLKPRAVMLADLGSTSLACIHDWHGTALHNWSIYRDPDMPIEIRFTTLLNTHVPFAINDIGDSGPGTISSWGEEVIGCPFATTMELGDAVPQADSKYPQFAEGYVKAFVAVFTGSLASTKTVTFSKSCTLTARPAGVLESNKTTTFTESVTLVGTGALAANDSVTFSHSATMATPGALVSSVSMTFAKAAAIVGIAVLTSTNTTTFNKSASLTGRAALASTQTMTFSESALMAGPAPLVSAMTFTFSQSATITGSTPEVPAFTRYTVAAEDRNYTI
jgi:hypothetical protein